MTFASSSRRRAFIVVLRVACLVAVPGAAGLLIAPAAHAQARPQRPLSQSLTGQAKTDFEAGKLLANDGDFAGALIKFQSAYDAARDPRLLWNVAFCQKNLRHYSKVVTTLRRYIDEGGAVLSAADKKDAQELITTLEPFTTRAVFHVNEDNAQIFVDDEFQGTSPLATPVVLDIGERHLRVVKAGFKTFEKALPVGGSASVTVEVALEKEVHEGKIIVDAPPGATIFLDEKQVGLGKVEETIPSGGHQLRVTAPGMRPYQTEIVIQDKETRSVGVALEPESAAAAAMARPMLRVAVGCGDTEPKGPDDGLVVYVDGPEVLAPGPVKQRWYDDLGRNAVERVEYPISPGPHTIRVAITGCWGLDLALVVDPMKGADVTGALESSRFVLFRGPQGTPGWYRAGVGLWFPGADVSQNVPEHYSATVGGTGIVGEVGTPGRWFGFWLNAAYASGSLTRNSFNTNYALPNQAHTTFDRLGMRFGPRIPFNVVSLGFGASMAYESVNLQQVRTGKGDGAFGGYTEIDVQPLCDFGLFVQSMIEKPTGDNAYFGTQVGVFWGPSPQCHKERETSFGLHGEAK